MTTVGFSGSMIARQVGANAHFGKRCGRVVAGAG